MIQLKCLDKGFTVSTRRAIPSKVVPKEEVLVAFTLPKF